MDFSFWKEYKVPIVLGLASIICIVFSLVILIQSLSASTPITFSGVQEAENISNQSTQSATYRTILVDIEGAVIHAGIVSVAPDSRVEDVLVKAGGLSNVADKEYVAKNINRAMKVSDGMKIYIPTAGEDETSHNLSPLLQRPDGQSQNGVVSVNMASKDELDSLPGVGPVTAQKIIDNRPYGTLEELVGKKAIGPSLFEKLKNQLSL